MNKILLIVLSIIGFSCSYSGDEKAVVDFSDTLPIEPNINAKGAKRVYIAIASMTSPKETYTYYGDLISYISDKVGHPIYIKQKKTYEEVNLLLERSEIDFAFICSGAFVEGYSHKKIKLLVAPEIDHKSTYYAYIITQKEASINSFEDFKNKSFAFTDPLSNTGRLFPLKELLKIKTNEKDFFSKTIYTYGHDISIQMVNRGIINGASVHGLIFDYLAENNPEKVENIKIIQYSETFGIPPVVTPISLPRDKANKYREIFLNIHKDSSGKRILDKLNINRFVVVDDTLYNNVFQLKKLINHEYKN
ncbi:MAG: phosphonate ABC transporter substrate-binding protein [Bacteroidetes bacterium 4572_77]|nr:MAG: phosphonate ABC transporter substrate-binding protein [Bacteroidetes bacterium 4572_77]